MWRVPVVTKRLPVRPAAMLAVFTLLLHARAAPAADEDPAQGMPIRHHCLFVFLLGFLPDWPGKGGAVET